MFLKYYVSTVDVNKPTISLHQHAVGEKQQLVSHLGEIGSWSYSWERGAAGEGNSCSCSWERRAAAHTAGHIAGRGEHLVIHLVEGDN